MAATSLHCLLTCFIFMGWNSQPSEAKTFEAMFSVISHNDWNIKLKEEMTPKFTETVTVKDFNPSPGSRQKKIEFTAFNRKWTLDTQMNPLFISKATSFDFRSVNGDVLSSEEPPKDCYYIGEVRAGDTETGEAAITTCYGLFRAMMITNRNTYMINPPLPINTPRIYKKRDIPDVPSHSEHGTYSRAKRAKTIPDFPEDWDVHVGPLPHIKGRKINTEVTLIVDETFINDYYHAFGGDKTDLYDYIINMFSFVQLWYVNPTLGFQNWVTLHKVIFVEDTWSIYLEDGTKYGLLASCNWQRRVFKDSGDWTVAAMISVKDDIWGGIGGLAFPGQGCHARTDGGNCLGVMHQSFQIDTLGRALSHELAHSLGVPDDYAPPTVGLCKSGLMTNGLYEDREWSTCSVQRMEHWLHVNGSDCVHFGKSPRVDTSNAPIIPVNVAWRAHVEQSSTDFDDEVQYGGWKATDGSFAPTPFGDSPDALLASFTQTKLQDDPWLLIELDDAYKDNDVYSVRIYNRVECCGERLHNLVIRIGGSRNFKSNPVCKKFNGAVPGGKNGMVDIRCDQTLKGKYISIEIIGWDEVLSVTEVFVMQVIDIAPVRKQFNCFDNRPNCQYYRYSSDCGNASIKKDCQLTCQYCTRDVTKPTMDSSRNDPGTTDSDVYPSCSDRSRECWHFLANQRCNERDAINRCPRSCGNCES